MRVIDSMRPMGFIIGMGTIRTLTVTGRKVAVTFLDGSTRVYASGETVAAA